MIKQLHAFLQGVRQALVLAPAAEYHLPQRGDTAQDARNLRQDAEQVCGDLTASVTKYGE